MRQTRPIWLLNKYREKLIDRMIPLRKTSLNGTIYYHRRGEPPHDPKAFASMGREFHHKIDSLSGDTALDVGANIGSYTLRLARRFRTVIAFEPDQSSSSILRLNVKVNELSNVRVEEVALANEAGVVPLYVRGGGATSLDRSHYGLKHDKVKYVRVARLDDFSTTPGRVDFVKVDAENRELSILRGARHTIAKFAPILAIEVHSATIGSSPTCACDTCNYVYGLAYDLEVTGESVSPTPAHWVWAVPRGEGQKTRHPIPPSLGNTLHLLRNETQAERPAK